MLQVKRKGKGKEKENKFGGGGSKLVVNKREGQTVRGERKGSEAKL
jgi:hypothetical protein